MYVCMYTFKCICMLYVMYAYMHVCMYVVCTFVQWYVQTAIRLLNHVGGTSWLNLSICQLVRALCYPRAFGPWLCKSHTNHHVVM